MKKKVMTIALSMMMAAFFSASFASTAPVYAAEGDEIYDEYYDEEYSDEDYWDEEDYTDEDIIDGEEDYTDEEYVDYDEDGYVDDEGNMADGIGDVVEEISEPFVDDSLGDYPTGDDLTGDDPSNDDPSGGDPSNDDPSGGYLSADDPSNDVLIDDEPLPEPEPEPDPDPVPTPNPNPAPGNDTKGDDFPEEGNTEGEDKDSTEDPKPASGNTQIIVKKDSENDNSSTTNNYNDYRDYRNYNTYNTTNNNTTNNNTTNNNPNQNYGTCNYDNYYTGCNPQPKVDSANYTPVKATNDSSPKTGDETPVKMIIMAIAAMVASAVAMLVIKLRRRETAGEYYGYNDYNDRF